jgi:hypothetical protein
MVRAINRRINPHLSRIVLLRGRYLEAVTTQLWNLRAGYQDFVRGVV